jgi:hypothetical protein
MSREWAGWAKLRGLHEIGQFSNDPDTASQTAQEFSVLKHSDLIYPPNSAEPLPTHLGARTSIPGRTPSTRI